MTEPDPCRWARLLARLSPDPAGFEGPRHVLLVRDAIDIVGEGGSILDVALTLAVLQRAGVRPPDPTE